MNKNFEVNGKTVNVTIEEIDYSCVEGIEELNITDYGLCIEVEGKKHDVLFQKELGGYILGHEGALSMKEEYKNLLLDLGGDVDSVDEWTERFDNAISKLNGWREIEVFVDSFHNAKCR